MGTLPKVGSIAAVATGFTLNYKLIEHYSKGYSSTNDSSTVAKVMVDEANIRVSLSPRDNYNSLLKKFIEDNPPFQKLKIWNEKYKDSIFNVDIKEDENIDALEHIKSINSENASKDSIIVNSPLEPGDFNSWLLDILNTQLLLHYVILYLLIMLGIIFICRFVLDKNIQFKPLSENRLLKFIFKLINNYINIWKTSSDFWVFLILSSLIIFTITSIFSFTQIISILSNI